MPEELFRRAAKAAKEARKGVGDRLPAVDFHEYIAETRDLPTLWKKSGLINKKHEVLGVVGTSIPVMDEGGLRFINRHDLVMGDRHITLEHVPVAVIDIPETGDRVLTSFHVHDNELTVLIHGILPSDHPTPRKKDTTIHVGTKLAIAGTVQSGFTASDYTTYSHEAIPLSREDSWRIVGERVKDLVMHDVATVARKCVEDTVWEQIAQIAESQREQYERVLGPARRRRIVERKREELPVDSESFAKVQRLIAENPELLDKLGLHAVNSVLQFQKELALAVARESAPDFVDTHRIKARVLSTDVVNLSKWPSFYKIFRFALKYKKLLEAATERGKLRVNIVYRTG